MGTPDNDDPRCRRADSEDAAARVAEILQEESADVLTIYDENGTYGHPDHIQVHRVGSRAAELAGHAARARGDHQPRARQGLIDDAAAAGEQIADESLVFGVPDEAITTVVDVGDFLDRAGGDRRPRQPGPRHRPIPGHATQVFSAALGTEFYIRRGARPITAHDVFAGVEPAAPAEAPPACCTRLRRRNAMMGCVTIVKINAITVPEDSGDELGRRFKRRAGAVDDQDGFEGSSSSGPPTAAPRGS